MGLEPRYEHGWKTHHRTISSSMSVSSRSNLDPEPQQLLHHNLHRSFKATDLEEEGVSVCTHGRKICGSQSLTMRRLKCYRWSSILSLSKEADSDKKNNNDNLLFRNVATCSHGLHFHLSKDVLYIIKAVKPQISASMALNKSASSQ